MYVCMYVFLDTGEGREKGRETSMCGCLLSAPYWGPGPQPRHAPWLGIKPVTLWFTGWCSMHRATPVRVPGAFLLRCYLFTFRERWREGERGDRNISLRETLQSIASRTPPATPGMGPDQELNQRPFNLQVGTQSTEPHQTGHPSSFCSTILNLLLWVMISNPNTPVVPPAFYTSHCLGWRSKVSLNLPLCSHLTFNSSCPVILSRSFRFRVSLAVDCFLRFLHAPGHPATPLWPGCFCIWSRNRSKMSERRWWKETHFLKIFFCSSWIALLCECIKNKQLKF